MNMRDYSILRLETNLCKETAILKFGLYRISLYPGFGSDRFHCVSNFPIKGKRRKKLHLFVNIEICFIQISPAKFTNIHTHKLTRVQTIIKS